MRNPEGSVRPATTVVSTPDGVSCTRFQTFVARDQNQRFPSRPRISPPTIWAGKMKIPIDPKGSMRAIPVKVDGTPGRPTQHQTFPFPSTAIGPAGIAVPDPKKRPEATVVA